MELLAGMAYSDAVVVDTIKRLHQAHGANAVISQEAISQASGVPINTVRRALRRLVKRNQLIGVLTVGVGYRYRINDGSSPTEGSPTPTARAG